jgi:hypothetical protein
MACQAEGVLLNLIFPMHSTRDRVWDMETGRCKLQIGLTWKEEREKKESERSRV